MIVRKGFPFLALISALFAAFMAFPAHAGDHFAPMDTPPKTIVQGEIVYVPVYSHIYLSDRTMRLLSATLSIRNTDPGSKIVVTGVRYYDTEGKRVETYLDHPHALAPLATAEFFINQVDRRGGSGANFIVEWMAGAKVSAPIVEAVMAGTSGTQAFSFIGTGRVVGTRP